MGDGTGEQPNLDGILTKSKFSSADGCARCSRAAAMGHREGRGCPRGPPTAGPGGGRAGAGASHLPPAPGGRGPRAALSSLSPSPERFKIGELQPRGLFAPCPCAPLWAPNSGSLDAGSCISPFPSLLHPSTELHFPSMRSHWVKNASSGSCRAQICFSKPECESCREQPGCTVSSQESVHYH